MFNLNKKSKIVPIVMCVISVGAGNGMEPAENPEAYYPGDSASLSEYQELLAQDMRQESYKVGDFIQFLVQTIGPDVFREASRATRIKLIDNLARTYMIEKGVVSDNYASTQAGDAFKFLVERLPGGESIIQMANQVKAPGHQTLGATIIDIIAPEFSRIDTNAAQADIIGGFAKSVVKNCVSYGGAITTATGFVGKEVFGTETLISGVIQTAGSFCEGVGSVYNFLFQQNYTEESSEEGGSSTES